MSTTSTLTKAIEVYKDKSVSIVYHPEINCVENTWKGFSSSESYRANMNRILEAMKKYKATCILGDTSEMKIVSSEDQKWTNEKWQPEAIKNGFNKNAIVVSNNMFNEAAVKNIVSKTASGASIEYKYFHSRKDAFAWLGGE